jgi:uncharacterized OB-fold protein
MPRRPQPRFPEPNTQPYWEAVKERKLMFQRCNACKGVVFTPRAHCNLCGSEDLSWEQSKGTGSVYTYSVVRQNRNPAFSDLGAYVVAYVDLDEGFRMMTNVVGVANPLTDVHCGQRVQVEFEEQESGEYPIPVFRPL